ncbi:DUF4279 domain-containing protein [Streptomyces geranii]|uniref:DUF4279 domain-containing protein n=1 Tax=Streptomyces geranii TaxID=2058923 RepID=UPI000D1C9E59|nr:DUF4279 domain-containing protein [Streptomyces geranii]
MPSGKWSAGALRISSRTISADDISEVLGIEPHRTAQQGSVWIRTSGLGNDRWPDEHIAALIRLLDGRHDALGRLAADCEVELVLGFGSEGGQGGCVLPAGLLKEIGLLGIDVVLDLYPPTPDDDPLPLLLNPSSTPTPRSDPPHPPKDPSAPPAH